MWLGVRVRAVDDMTVKKFPKSSGVTVERFSAFQTGWISLGDDDRRTFFYDLPGDVSFAHAVDSTRVRPAGIEPARPLWAPDFEAGVTTYSTRVAYAERESNPHAREGGRS